MYFLWSIDLFPLFFYTPRKAQNLAWSYRWPTVQTKKVRISPTNTACACALVFYLVFICFLQTLHT